MSAPNVETEFDKDELLARYSEAVPEYGIQAGDVLVVKAADTADPGDVAVVIEDRRMRLAEYVPGMAIKAVVTGLLERLG